MPKLKANVKVFEAHLKKRGTYTIDGHPGLNLASRGDGNGSWRVRYRPPGGGNPKWHTLFSDAKNTEFDKVKDAKDDFFAELRKDHVDPKARMKADVDAKIAADRAEKLTLGTVIDEWIAKPREKNLRPTTLKLYRWIFHSYISPDFGKRPIAGIAKKELAEHFTELTARLQKSGGRDGQGTRGEMAGKAFTYLQAVFEFAVDQDYIVKSPMRGLARPVPKEPDQKATRPLRQDELRKLWRELDTHASHSFARMIRLALLLGRRRAEIALAEKDELHLDGDEPHWIVPPREGNKSAMPSLVPLPPLAAELLRAAVRDAGESRFVFPQSRGALDQPTRPDPLSHAWRDACDAIGITDEVRLHDARSLIIDEMERMGVPDNIISHVAHHTSDMKGTTAKRVYSTNTFSREKRRALRLWQARLRNIVSGKRLHALRWRG